MFDLTKPPGLGRRVVMCGLAHGAAWLNDVVDLLVDNQAPIRALSPFPADLQYDDCSAARGEQALMAAVRARREAGSQGSALVESAVWEPAFASDVRVGSLLALDGPMGRRALRVTRLRGMESPYGSVELVTFLLVDAESGEPGSLTVPLFEALTVAFEAPESLAEIAGGAS